MASAETLAILKRMDVATTNIADDVRRLTANSDNPAVKAEAERIAQRLEGLAADTADPVPDVPPSV